MKFLLVPFLFLSLSLLCSISSEFLALMKKVSKSPLVMDILNIPGVQKSLECLAREDPEGPRRVWRGRELLSQGTGCVYSVCVWRKEGGREGGRKLYRCTDGGKFICIS